MTFRGVLAGLNLSVIIASLDATSPSRGGLGIGFIFRNDRLLAPKRTPAARFFTSSGTSCHLPLEGKALRQQGKQEQSVSPRKRDGLPRAPLLGELPSVSDG